MFNVGYVTLQYPENHFPQQMAHRANFSRYAPDLPFRDLVSRFQPGGRSQGFIRSSAVYSPRFLHATLAGRYDRGHRRYDRGSVERKPIAASVCRAERPRARNRGPISAL